MTAADDKINKNPERKCNLEKDQSDCKKQDRVGDYSNLFSTGGHSWNPVPSFGDYT